MTTVLPLILLAVALVGVCIGSFLNVVIHRVPKMLERGWREQCAELAGKSAVEEPAYTLWVPRSQSPACARPIRAIENVPVVSYMMLRGRCAGCKASISPRYPVVEVLTAGLSICAVLRFGAT